jgi:hypothetical protein
MGLDSPKFAQLSAKLVQWLHRTRPVSLSLRYPSISLSTGSPDAPSYTCSLRTVTLPSCLFRNMSR